MRTVLSLLLWSLSPAALAAPKPDLLFHNVEVIPDGLGGVQLKLIVRNQNTVSSGTTFVHVFTDPDDGDWTDCGEPSLEAYVPGLAPGATYTTVFDLDAADTQGPIFFFIDLDAIVAESHEGNNEGSAVFLPNGQPRVTLTTAFVDNPACLEADILAEFGAAIIDAAVMFFAKLRVL